MSNGWNEYQKLVMATLEKHSEHLESITIALTDNSVEHARIRGEVGALKVKASIWGAIAGAFPSLLALGYILIKG